MVCWASLPAVVRELSQRKVDRARVSGGNRAKWPVCVRRVTGKKVTSKEVVANDKGGEMYNQWQGRESVCWSMAGGGKRCNQ